MCGIVGYIGHRDALSVLLSGLEKLEYRGYDSAGVAILDEGQIMVTRALGKLSELKRLFEGRGANAKSSIGIGHTRWATHGKPSENNAHPHTAGRVSLIHNGIIENYVELRARLVDDGAVFSSETDTEIAAHLVNKYLQAKHAPLEALRLACADMKGSYAFLFIDRACPDRILIAKNATPIVIGVGEGEMFVASDIPAILGYTRKMIILEEGDFAEITVDACVIENNGAPVAREVHTITWDPMTAQKGGFKHFMLKEIHDQSRAVSDTFCGRIQQEEGVVSIPEITMSDEDMRRVQRVLFVACGTAWHAALVAKFYIESLAGLPCEVDYASECRYRSPVIDGNTLVVAISQSGETADTLAAVDLAMRRGQALAICNVLGSSLGRKVSSVLYTHAGPEISVASTKAFMTQLVAAYLLGVYLGQRRGVLDHARSRVLLENLNHLPAAIDQAVKTEAQIEKIARKFHHASDFLYVARGICYPIALEGALKLKEISYVHAEGYPAGELKHGPIALIDEEMPVAVLLQRSSVLFEKTMSNLKEIESREGRIVAITDEPAHPELRRIAEDVVEVPFISEELAPMLMVIPLQLLAYHVAVLNGTDVDLPRNLAKSVTVE